MNLASILPNSPLSQPQTGTTQSTNQESALISFADKLATPIFDQDEFIGGPPETNPEDISFDNHTLSLINEIESFEAETNINILLFPDEIETFERSINEIFEEDQQKTFDRPDDLVEHITQVHQMVNIIKEAYPLEILRQLSPSLDGEESPHDDVVPLTIVPGDDRILYGNRSVLGLYYGSRDSLNFTESTFGAGSGNEQQTNTIVHELAHTIDRLLYKGEELIPSEEGTQYPRLSKTVGFHNALKEIIVDLIGREGESYDDLVQILEDDLNNTQGMFKPNVYNLGRTHDKSTYQPQITERLNETKAQDNTITISSSDVRTLILAVEGDVATEEVFAELLSFASGDPIAKDNGIFYWLDANLPNIRNYFEDKGLLH